MKKALFLFVLVLQPVLLVAQPAKSIDPQRTITADSARRSITELLNEMARKHPGFYRYTPKAAFTHFIDSSLAAIDRPLNQLEYYRKLKPLIAKIHCVHTSVSLPDSYINDLNQQPNMLPLDVYFKGEQAFIIHNYSDNRAVPIGAELLSINGHSIKTIKDQLFTMISADGFNQTWKYQALNNRFAQAYRANYEIAKTFKIMVATSQGNKEFVLSAVTNNAIPMPVAMDRKQQPRLDFVIDDSVAILSIRSFGDTDIKAGGQQFKKFMAGVFKDLKANHIQELVIDLRDNTGGSDPNAALLCRYLINRPFRYWDRIEVTAPFALSLKGSAKLVYGKPVKVDSVYLWRKSHFTHEFDFYEQQQPQADVYNGKLVLLVNGACLSSCADVAAVLQYNERAVLLGEETGGGYQGNNSGLIPEAKIDFGIKVSIPLLKYINAVDLNKNVAHGTFPDISYDLTIDDVLQNRDPIRKLAIQQVKKMGLSSP